MTAEKVRWIVDEVHTPNGVAYFVNRLWTGDDGETRTDEIAEVVMDYAGDVPLQHARTLAAAPALLDVCRAMVAEDDRLERTGDVITNMGELVDAARKLLRSIGV